MNLKMCEISTDVDKLKVDLQETFMKYSTIKKWAYIIHDKDDTRPHYHIALHFGGASVDTKQVAEWFQLSYTDKDGNEHSGENFVERVKCKRWSGIDSRTSKPTKQISVFAVRSSRKFQY